MYMGSSKLENFILPYSSTGKLKFFQLQYISSIQLYCFKKSDREILIYLKMFLSNISLAYPKKIQGGKLWVAKKI